MLRVYVYLANVSAWLSFFLYLRHLLLGDHAVPLGFYMWLFIFILVFHSIKIAFNLVQIINFLALHPIPLLHVRCLFILVGPPSIVT